MFWSYLRLRHFVWQIEELPPPLGYENDHKIQRFFWKPFLRPIYIYIHFLQVFECLS